MISINNINHSVAKRSVHICSTQAKRPLISSRFPYRGCFRAYRALIPEHNRTQVLGTRQFDTLRKRHKFGTVAGAWSSMHSQASCAHSADMGVTVTSAFDSGNIEVVELRQPGDLVLRIMPEPFSPTDNRAHFQWFNFRVAGAKGKPLTMSIVNAGDASYAPAWEGYQACASYDSEHWLRVATSYDAGSGTLTMQHRPEHNMVQYAYFAPYSLDRHAALIQRMQVREGVESRVLGCTLEGRTIDLLQVGQVTAEKKKVWIIARQHPGESQAEWFMEGLLDRLTDPHDPVARAVRRRATFFCVPNMNPDGSFRGHLRTNAAGVNLNRVWAAPELATSPEVFHTLSAMKGSGLDLLLDVHGDEELPYSFVAGLDGIPSWGLRLQALQAAFRTALATHSPDFQTVYGYPTDEPGQANLKLCSKQVGELFGSLSLTLEMPFKDNANLPDPQVGWSPRRAALLGGATLGAINDIADKLSSKTG